MAQYYSHVSHDLNIRFLKVLLKFLLLTLFLSNLVSEVGSFLDLRPHPLPQETEVDFPFLKCIVFINWKMRFLNICAFFLIQEVQIQKSIKYYDTSNKTLKGTNTLHTWMYNTAACTLCCFFSWADTSGSDKNTSFTGNNKFKPEEILHLLYFLLHLFPSHICKESHHILRFLDATDLQ